MLELLPFVIFLSIVVLPLVLWNLRRRHQMRRFAEGMSLAFSGTKIPPQVPLPRIPGTMIVLAPHRNCIVGVWRGREIFCCDYTAADQPTRGRRRGSVVAVHAVIENRGVLERSDVAVNSRGGWTFVTTGFSFISFRLPTQQILELWEEMIAMANIQSASHNDSASHRVVGVVIHPRHEVPESPGASNAL